MTMELLAALISCLLAPINAIVAATANASVMGFSWGLGNRERAPQLPQWAIRLTRSHTNLIENLPSFLGVVFVAHLANVHDNYTVIAAWGFVVARAVFLVIYTCGITFAYLRTLVFFLSIVCIGLIATRTLMYATII